MLVYTVAVVALLTYGTRSALGNSALPARSKLSQFIFTLGRAGSCWFNSLREDARIESPKRLQDHRLVRGDVTGAGSFATIPNEYALFTIPKAGSHLLIKLLYLMCGSVPNWHTTPVKVAKLQAQGKYPYTHFVLSDELCEFYARSPQIKKIVGVRDLRDVCVSVVHQILKGAWPEFTGNKERQAWFQSLSFDEQLMFVICQNYKQGGPFAKLQVAISQASSQAALFSKDPHLLICHYEDLVGPLGGGSEERQRKEVERVASFLGLTLSVDKIDKLVSLLYGNEINPFGRKQFSGYQSTFRKGQIGAWRGVFNEEHIKVFKERLGQALIDLGYEKDLNW